MPKKSPTPASSECHAPHLQVAVVHSVNVGCVCSSVFTGFFTIWSHGKLISSRNHCSLTGMVGLSSHWAWVSLGWYVTAFFPICRSCRVTKTFSPVGMQTKGMRTSRRSCWGSTIASATPCVKMAKAPLDNCPWWSSGVTWAAVAIASPVPPALICVIATTGTSWWSSSLYWSGGSSNWSSGSTLGKGAGIRGCLALRTPGPNAFRFSICVWSSWGRTRRRACVVAFCFKAAQGHRLSNAWTTPVGVKAWIVCWSLAGIAESGTPWFWKSSVSWVWWAWLKTPSPWINARGDSTWEHAVANLMRMKAPQW